MTTVLALQTELDQIEDSIRSLRYERSQITLKLEQHLREADRLKRQIRSAMDGETNGGGN